MESTTAQVLLTELEIARGSLERAFACLVPVPKALNNEREVLSNPLPRNHAIKVVTENGFVIERLCEREGSRIDSASGCHFVVRGPEHEERHVTVVFGEEFIDVILGLQRANRLSLDSPFWLQCAESHLANYIWEKNDFPAGELLILSKLTNEDLRLAMRASGDEIFPNR